MGKFIICKIGIFGILPIGFINPYYTSYVILNHQLLEGKDCQSVRYFRGLHFMCRCWIVCFTNPFNDQLVKDEGAQIFYSIRSQTKPIGIGANCEIPHNPSLAMRLQRLLPMTLTLIPLVEPCAL